MNRFSLSCLFGLLTLSSVSAAEGKTLFEETFTDKLQPGWTWIREDPADWCIRAGGLDIHVRPGDARSVRNALVRLAPDRRIGAFAIEVTVRNRIPPTEQYEQAGLTWYNDGKPVFKLVKERVDGELMIIPGRKPMSAAKVQLRLVVEGDRYTAQYRPNGQGQYLTAASGELPPPADDRVSIQCYHGPTTDEHWIRFDDFRIVKLGD